MVKNPNKNFLKKCEKNSKKFFYIKKKYYICGEKQNEQHTMKKTYLIIVLVDKFAKSDSYKDIERHWEIPVTITAFSKTEAINKSHTIARTQAQVEYGTRIGNWRTRIDQITTKKIN